MSRREQQACFFETDPGRSLIHRAAIEGVGTLLLMFAAPGSRLQVCRLIPTETGFGRLIGALTVAGALAGLIIALGAISGGHFDPATPSYHRLLRPKVHPHRAGN